MRNIYYTVILITLLTGGEQVKSARFYIQNDSVILDITFENLFSEKIRGTIKSGLTSSIDIELKLVAEKTREKITEKQITIRAHYDIWNEQYQLTIGDSTKILTSFTTLQYQCENLKEIPLIHIYEISHIEPLSLWTRVTVNPISADATKRMQDWATETLEETDDDEKGTLFRFDLNSLIKWFMKRNNNSQTSNWFVSSPFTIRDLKNEKN